MKIFFLLPFLLFTAAYSQVEIDYCVSCSYKKNFLVAKDVIEQNFGLEVKGENYPPPWYADVAVKGVQLAQGVTVILLFGGARLLRGDHPVLRFIYSNQIQLFIFLFLASLLAQNLAPSGAFEIYLDGKELFSKLKTGRMPQLEEIIRLLEDSGLTRTGNWMPTKLA